MSEMISRRSHGFRIHVQGETPLNRAGALLLAIPRSLLRAAHRTWSVYADERLLQDLSDHQLRDIGIHRRHIPHIVRNSWDL